VRAAMSPGSRTDSCKRGPIVKCAFEQSCRIRLRSSQMRSRLIGQRDHVCVSRQFKMRDNNASKFLSLAKGYGVPPNKAHGLFRGQNALSCFCSHGSAHLMAQHCSGFGARTSLGTHSMRDMPITAEKIEEPSANALLLRDLLTIAEAAERLKLAPKTVRKLCLSHRLTAIRVQRSWRIPLAALDEFLRDRLIPRI
jgi:excisionase family DNA binding protein